MAEEDTNDQCCLSQQTEQQNLFNPPSPPPKCSWHTGRHEGELEMIAKKQQQRGMLALSIRSPLLV